ncbi:MAG TPA: hypothetical protein PKH93_07965 [Chitinophagales bacterium]|nr:hypothetical protein [Chitinophagales bacterium]
MVAHGGESPTRKANARRHVVHAAVERNKQQAHLNPHKFSQNQKFHAKFCEILQNLA